MFTGKDKAGGAPSIRSVVLHSARKPDKINQRETPAKSPVADARALRSCERAGGSSLSAAAGALSRGNGQLQPSEHSALAARLGWGDRLSGGAMAVCPSLP